VAAREETTDVKEVQSLDPDLDLGRLESKPKVPFSRYLENAGEASFVGRQ
jgi:hypothetical protein